MNTALRTAPVYTAPAMFRPFQSRFPVVGCLFALALLVMLTGCKSASGRGPSIDYLPGEVAFSPVSLRIHPLTHVELETAGDQRTLLILHFELLDRTADAVKGLGSLQVELYRPGPGATPGIESQALRWDIPEFADIEGNSRRFDTATRTYRVQLVAPPWVSEWLSEDGGSRLRGSSPRWLRLRAAFTTAEGPIRTFDDEFIVQ